MVVELSIKSPSFIILISQLLLSSLYSTYREIQDEDICVISHVLVESHHQHHQDVPDGPDDDDEREENGNQVGN